MEELLKPLLNSTAEQRNVHRPEIFHLSQTAETHRFKTLLASGQVVRTYDTLYDQLRELIKVRRPAARLSEEDCDGLIRAHLGGVPPDEYGVWIFYPWSGNLVHLLDEAEFREVRTSRNKYKITAEEQEALSAKKIGIAGLSVGQSIALTLAMERGFGELRLADFDILELSNLNRIRSGVHEMGNNKVINVAREIAELDPYLKVTCYTEGITEGNLEAFLLEGGKLDLLIDECDGLDMKIRMRQKARELQIPVLMDTSDRGMIDIERFDLEPARPLLHGLVGDIDADKLAHLSNEDKIPIILQIAGSETVSVRGKASLIEVGQSISTWPQLASSVALGGGAAADVARRLLLGHLQASGRFYVDPEEIIKDEPKNGHPAVPNPYAEPQRQDRDWMIGKAAPLLAGKEKDMVPAEVLSRLVDAGIAAPSTGNDQPWLWDYKDGVLYLFHDRSRSFSFGDFRFIASYLTFGAVSENVLLQAGKEGYDCSVHPFPLGQDEWLVTVFTFRKRETPVAYPLAEQIFTRSTNRLVTPRTEPDAALLQELNKEVGSLPGAELHWLTDAESIRTAGRIIGACDRIRILNPRGHHDFVHHEMRWTPRDAEQTQDGIDIQTLGLSTGQMAALSVVKDSKVIDFVRNVKGGQLFQMATQRSIAASSALGLITLPHIAPDQYLAGGRALERLWLAAEHNGWAIHPVISPLYLFPRILQGNGEELSQDDIQALRTMRAEFLDLWGIKDGLAEVFLFKIFKADKPEKRALRRPLASVLTIHS